MLRSDQRQRVERATNAHVDDIGQAGMRDVDAGNRRVLRVEFQRDQATARRERAGEPDRTVAGKRADLEDVARAPDARYEVEQLPFVRRDTDRGKAGRSRGGQCRFERGVSRDEEAGDVLLDGGPLGLGH